MGLTGNVKVELSTNNGSTWSTLFASVPNSGRVSWTPRGAGSQDALVRITSLSNPTVTSQSAAPFAIIAPSITVTAPVGGEQWLVGSVHAITWNSVSVTGNVSVDLVSGGQVRHIGTAKVSDGQLVWTVTGAPTSGVIRITAGNGANAVVGTSAAAITLVKPTLTVSAPGAGALWKPGTSQTINWSGTAVSLGGGSVDILLSRDGGATYSTIIQDAANTGSITWPVSGARTHSAKIKVVWKTDPTVFGVSSGVFTIGKK